jgi:hypothetical protein
MKTAVENIEAYALKKDTNNNINRKLSVRWVLSDAETSGRKWPGW